MFRLARWNCSLRSRTHLYLISGISKSRLLLSFLVYCKRNNLLWCSTQKCFVKLTKDEDVRENDLEDSYMYDGLEGEAIIPTEVASDFSSSDDVCPICLEPVFAYALECKHRLCVDCAVSWFKRGRPKCPQCRAEKSSFPVPICVRWVGSACFSPFKRWHDRLAWKIAVAGLSISVRKLRR